MLNEEHYNLVNLKKKKMNWSAYNTPTQRVLNYSYDLLYENF